MIIMTRKTVTNMKCAAAAMAVGGLAFAATKAVSSSKKHIAKKATGKAMKAVGTIIETFKL